jgi:tRNAThr (cytosine32-N3)-methyltransferase
MTETSRSEPELTMQELPNAISTLDINPTTSGADTDRQTSPPETHSPPTTNSKRTSPFQFGQRYLEPTDDVFSYNAWDHVTPDSNHDLYCQEQYAKQRLHPVSAFDKNRFNTSPAKWWDLFYKQKSSTFFKDRKWLRQEFPVLDQVTRRGVGRKVVLEVGAGAGNTAFPIVRGNENEELRVHAVDFSAKAVETMRSADDYDEQFLRADVWDVATDAAGEDDDGENAGLPPGLTQGSVDIVIMIFVFSALSPKQWARAVQNIWRVLKPGGEVLFRDYGRGDLAQVRFKASRWMEENFYVRGDGTRVYFFEKEELMQIWGGEAKVEREWEGKGEGADAAVRPDGPGFEILNLDVDRRLIVNRQKKIKMYRCWIQGHFKKPDQLSVAASTGPQGG